MKQSIFTKHPFEDFKVEEIHNQILMAFVNIEENIIKDILFKHLGRNSDVDDWVKVSKVFNAGVFNNYQLVYDGKLLANVTHCLNDMKNGKITIEYELLK